MSHENYPTSSGTTLMLLCFSLIAGGLAIIFSTQLTNRAVGVTNQTYLRAIDCKLSVPAEQRTPAYIKQCYAKAEATTGTKVDHYGSNNQ